MGVFVCFFEKKSFKRKEQRERKQHFHNPIGDFRGAERRFITMEEIVNESKLRRDFNWRTLLLFAAPSMLLNLWLGVYQLINSAISSSMINTDALASIDICYPILAIEEGLAAMLGAGICAIVGKKLGEGKQKEACSNLSTMLLFGIVVTAIYLAVVSIFKVPILQMLGATDRLMPYCENYVNVHVFFGVFYMIQMAFQLILVVAGKPGVGCTLTVVAGIVEIIAADLFIGTFHLGITGSALGAGCGMLVSAIGSIIVMCNKKQELHFGKPGLQFKLIRKTCWLGVADLIQSGALGVITALYNIVSIKYFGEDGCAAITILLYSQWLFASSLYGYGKGIGPVISYNLGEERFDKIKRYLKIGSITILIFSVVIFVAACLLAKPVISLYCEPGSAVFEMTKKVFWIFSLNYLLYGIGTMATTVFVSLNDGFRGTILATFRAIVFPILLLVCLPYFLGGFSIWITMPVSELLSVLLAFILLWTDRKNLKFEALEEN